MSTVVRTYREALQALSPPAGRIRNPVRFNKTAPLLYANSSAIEEKLEWTEGIIAPYLATLKIPHKLSFNKNEPVIIPDLHGDFEHLMVTLYRHGLIHKDFNLDPKHEYIFLGDFYDRGDNSDIIDLWLNKQLEKEITCYRLVGNHEVGFFVTNDGIPHQTPNNDFYNDLDRGLTLTRDLLKTIAEGKIQAAYLFYDKKTNAPILVVHSFIIQEDFDKLQINMENIEEFVRTLNERLIKIASDAYSSSGFETLSNLTKYNYRKVTEIFSSDHFFTLRRDSDTGEYSSYLKRRAKEVRRDVFSTNIAAKLPRVYQIVGHTPLKYFENESPKTSNYPHISGTPEGYVQFSDVGIGYYFLEPLEGRPQVVIKPQLARTF